MKNGQYFPAEYIVCFPGHKFSTIVTNRMAEIVFIGHTAVHPLQFYTFQPLRTLAGVFKFSVASQFRGGKVTDRDHRKQL